MRSTGHGDLILEVAFRDARGAGHALENEQSAHVGGAEHEFAGIIGLPIGGGGPAGLTDDIRGKFVPKVPIFLEKLQVGHGLDDLRFGRTELLKHVQNMLANMLPQLLLKKNALGLTLGVNKKSDGGILVHSDSGS